MSDRDEGGTTWFGWRPGDRVPACDHHDLTVTLHTARCRRCGAVCTLPPLWAGEDRMRFVQRLQDAE